MFPNPQAALPLPARPDLEQYRKLAKELLAAAKSPDPDAIRSWSAKWVKGLAERAGIQIPSLPTRIDRWTQDVAAFAHAKLSDSGKLSDAQFVIARSHGFPGWPAFLRHIRNAGRTDSPEARFEAAADAIVTGDIEGLRRLLHSNPELVHRRSTREHRATLLHYVSANGVEGYRQKTPRNIVEISRELLRAGADVDAAADVYRGDCTALGLVATSVHPQTAGVQRPLLQLLLDHGARMDRLGLAGGHSPLVLACLHNGQPDAARFLADHGAPLDLEAAAGTGRLALVKSFFDPEGRLLPPATHRQLQNGFLWACQCGHGEVALFLLERGAGLLDPADIGATALHWAAGAADLGLVKFLIERGAPLEVENRWGGTVLGHAGHGFEHGPAGLDFVPVFDALLAAGAEIRGAWLQWLAGVDSRSIAEKERLAEVLRRYGATE